MRDLKQLGYAILFFIGVIGIGQILLSGGNIWIIVAGIAMILISLSPLLYFIIEAWQEDSTSENSP